MSRTVRISSALIGFTLFTPCFAADAESESAPADETLADEEFVELFREFVDAVDRIDRDFVREVDRRELIEAAIAGMVDELDPYSAYVPPADLGGFNEAIDKQFGGVGMQVQVDPKTRRLVVFSPLPGTPAYRGGVRAGDVIVEAGGESTEDMTLAELVTILKGEPGEPVTIGVVHRGETEVETIEIVREVIRVPTILGAGYRPGGDIEFGVSPGSEIAYLRLTNFTRRTGRDLRRVLRRLVRQGTEALVLDLRFNPGGLLDQAVEVCDLFLEEGVIVSTDGRNVEETVWRAKEAGTLPPIPVAVLVNRFSASAAEIVSACLQDQGRAVVIGERTFGKGSVQSVVPLADGESLLKLTTAAYHRPSGENIHRFPDATEDDPWGVTPDEGYLDRYDDADLRGLIDLQRERDRIPEAGASPEGDGTDESDDEPFVDRHLERAVEYLRGELEAAEDAPADAALRPAA